MSITMPNWAQNLPHPALAPCPEMIAQVHAPLAALIPLLQQGQAYGHLTLVPCIENWRGTISDSVIFDRHRTAAPSSHALLADPWLRPGDNTPEHTLQAAARRVADVLHQMFAGHLHGRETIQVMGEGEEMSFLLTWPHRAFILGPGRDQALHLATLLAILQRVLSTTPLAKDAESSPRCSAREARMEIVMPRITALGLHMNTFFPNGVWH